MYCPKCNATHKWGFKKEGDKFYPWCEHTNTVFKLIATIKYKKYQIDAIPLTQEWEVEKNTPSLFSITTVYEGKKHRFFEEEPDLKVIKHVFNLYLKEIKEPE